ncbi:MAG TPA: hypothetical protein VIH18_27020, partial [Candidatus Binatia bacterium]
LEDKEADDGRRIAAVRRQRSLVSSAEEFERFVFGTGLVNGKRIVGKFRWNRQPGRQLGPCRWTRLAALAPRVVYISLVGRAAEISSEISPQFRKESGPTSIRYPATLGVERI